jgi:hypothetical protein
LSRDESLDCALSFFIKSGIPVIASANRHILLEMWARMDSCQLFSVFNEWMKKLEYVIESGGEYYTQKRFALITYPFTKIESGQLLFNHPVLPT